MKPEYEQLYYRVEDRHWWMRARRQIIGWLVRRVSPGLDSRILEIGCSGGLLLQEFRRAGLKHVTGIDISPAAIALCHERGIADAHVMDAQSPTLAGQQYDLLVASDVLEHLPDDALALAAWNRLLKPGGRLFVFVPAFPLLWSEHDEANRHFRRYRRPGLRQRLESQGFVVERASYWNFSLFLPVLALRLAKRLLPRRAAAPERPDLYEVPGPLNAALGLLLGLENRCLASGVNWPFGVSVMAVARKPSHPGKASSP
jgi:SAM-dependent methyltransferase